MADSKSTNPRPTELREGQRPATVQTPPVSFEPGTKPMAPKK